MGVKGLNHAVLFVSDAQKSTEFYGKALGMEPVSTMPGAAFLSSPSSDRHHDLGLFQLQPGAPKIPTGAGTGLYHLAWEVESIDELSDMVQRLSELGSLVGMSDHGVSKSLYAKDPDGIEFEVLWVVPEADWGDYARDAVVKPLDLKRELERYSVRAPSAD
jgi:catechol-2,3-dioxygenase